MFEMSFKFLKNFARTRVKFRLNEPGSVGRIIVNDYSSVEDDVRYHG